MVLLIKVKKQLIQETEVMLSASNSKDIPICYILHIYYSQEVIQDISGRISNAVINFSGIFSYQKTPSNSAELK